jgi:hypothetical protein
MKRSELFNLVWAEAVTKVAARFGMSDRGLAKLCARHHIPLPERGYWAKVKGGQYPARMPLPRPDDDHEIPLKESAASGDPVAALSDTMSRLFGRTSSNDPEPEQPQANDQLAPEQQGLSKSAEPKMKRGVGRPRKLVNIPIDSGEVSGGRAAATAKPLPQLPQALQSSPTTMQPTALMVLESECQRAMVAGMEYQRRQAAQAFLGAVVANAYGLDEATSTAVLNWARAVHTRLSMVDPVDAVINEIRASAVASGSNNQCQSIK